MCQISIIVPIYNAERFLRECLDSVFAQTYSSWECICIDDGSTDGSANIVKEYTQKDIRFRLIQTPNCGASHARNIGIKMAKGDFITFLDSDDIMHPECLKRMMELKQVHGGDLFIFKYRKFLESKDIVFARREGQNQVSTQPFEDVLDGKFEVPLFMWGKMFAYYLLKGLSLDETMRVYEDTLFCLDVIHRCKKLVQTDEELYYYRSNPQSLTGRTDYANQLKYVYKNLRKASAFEQAMSYDVDWKIRYYGLSGGSLFWILSKNAIVQYGYDGDKRELLRAKRLYFSAKRRGILQYSKQLAPFSFRLFVRLGFDLGCSELLGWLAAHVI